MNLQIELSNTESGVERATADITTAAAANGNYIEQAWHVLALLLSLGRPARPTELASRCTLFYTTPDFIEFLCSLPESPIHLNCRYFVTFSSIGYVALLNLFANSDFWGNLNYVPRFFGEIGLSRERSGEIFRTYFRKRKRMDFDGDSLPLAKRRGVLDRFDADDNNMLAFAMAVGAEIGSAKVCFSDNHVSKTLSLHLQKPPTVSSNESEPKRILRRALFMDSGNKTLMSDRQNAQSKNELILVNRSGSSDSCYVDRDENQVNLHTANLSVNHVTMFPSIVLSTAAEMEDDSQQIKALQTQSQLALNDCECVVNIMTAPGRALEKPPYNSCSTVSAVNFTIDPTEKELSPTDSIPDNAATEQGNVIMSKDKCNGKPINSQENLMNCEIPGCSKEQVMPFPGSRIDQKNTACDKLRLIRRTQENVNGTHSSVNQQQLKKQKKSPPLNHLLQQDSNQNDNTILRVEGDKKHGQKASGQLEQKVLPDFESFIAEDEEGSGGYGTVYKARRKNDGAAFAIKCPHVNANRNHVRNELRMLERFGGKNFIIKYEGSFKNGDSDCLVLEHVEHDRPEVLKREMNISELQWYGFCMFRALASLHKQGIIHRDVKPGNFLFNRKACKGFLIDFNLAMDLYQKHGCIEKTRARRDVSFAAFPLSHSQSLPPPDSRKALTSKALPLDHQEQGKVSKFLLQSKKTKKGNEHQKHNNKVSKWNKIGSQGADGSGITSAKETTSTMTLSGEKRKEPLPSQGRKELISLVKEALQGEKQKEVSGPISKRKRVEAPPQLADHKIVYQTPMPLHSAGVAIGGSGFLKSKGSGKNIRDGPCVGTKGFRAPEVLFRSQHQGPKLDVWSAGVTLLYLMIGRSPFTGEPDQNVKEIAKLRGSEDLWEVAKLHGRESSFPADLLEVKSLKSMKLRDWCKLHTRRPDFLNVFPRSLFDLVDMCLTVNPRLRISAEDALKHEFFAPCHEALRKHRLLRQGVTQDPCPNVLSQVESQESTEVS